MKNMNLADAIGDDERFDRLVEGDLSADEYRAVLAALDDEPGSWRRCALAFLEAQALASELGHIRCNLDQRQGDTKPSQAPAMNPCAVQPERGVISWRGKLSMLAIAASFIAALALGIVTQHFFSAGGKDLPLTGNLTTQRTGGPLAGDGVRHHALRPIGNVRLVMDGAEGDESLAGNVPVYEAGADLEEFLTRDDAVLGSELVDLLRQYGYDVRHEQQFVPAPLEDGRQIIVPVDGYQITPVSRRY